MTYGGCGDAWCGLAGYVHSCTAAWRACRSCVVAARSELEACGASLKRYCYGHERPVLMMPTFARVDLGLGSMDLPGLACAHALGLPLPGDGALA